MIDRKALGIYGLIFLAMVAAGFWQVSLLPGSHSTVSVLTQFALPAALLLQLAPPFLQWLTLPKETLASSRRWRGKWIVSWSVFFALLQAFVLAHALGLVSLPVLGPGRIFLVLTGIIFMMMGNATPKSPLMPQRASFELDPWRQNRMLRFVGKLLFGLGLAFAVGGVLLPLEYWRPVFLGLMLAALAAGIWFGVKLRHEPRGKVLGDAR